MILKDLSDSIIFDSLPLKYDVKTKIILTHLLHIDNQILPEKMCTIVTTKKIAHCFKSYCDLKGYKGLTKDNFIYVEPFTETKIVIDRRNSFTMLFCESDDLSGNLMVLIKEDYKFSYVYAGNFVDMRTAILNDTYVLWTKADPPQYLYLNLKRSDENPLVDIDIDQNEPFFNRIQMILENRINYGINLYLPILGYERFIQKLCKTFCKLVALSSNFKCIFDSTVDDDDISYMLKNTDNAKIVLFPGIPNATDTRNNYKTEHKITVQIKRTNATKFEMDPTKSYYQLFYKPEPSPFELQTLCALIRPKRICAIIDTENSNTRVPKYLIELSKGNEDYSLDEPKKDRRKSLIVNTESANEVDKSVKVGPLANELRLGVFLESDSDSSL